MFEENYQNNKKKSNLSIIKQEEQKANKSPGTRLTTGATGPHRDALLSCACTQGYDLQFHSKSLL